MSIAPEEAARLKCPIARTFSEKKGHNCMGPDCILWRWGKVQWEMTEFTRATDEALAELKAGTAALVSRDNARAKVRSDPERYGLHAHPTHGYCGLGGKPE